MAKKASLDKAELDLLAQIQPAAWKTAPAHKRFIKTLSKDEELMKLVKDLEEGDWVEKQGEVWVPTERGYLALMLTPRVVQGGKKG